MDRGTLAFQVAKYALAQQINGLQPSSPSLHCSPDGDVGVVKDVMAAADIVSTADAAVLLGTGADNKRLQALHFRRRVALKQQGHRSLPSSTSPSAPPCSTALSCAASDTAWRSACHFLTLFKNLPPQGTDHSQHNGAAAVSHRKLFAHAVATLSHTTHHARGSRGQWSDALAAAATLVPFACLDPLSAATVQRTYNDLMAQAAMSVGGHWQEVLAQVRGVGAAAESTMSSCITASNFRNQLCQLRNGHGLRWREALAFGLVTPLHHVTIRYGSRSSSRLQAPPSSAARLWTDDDDEQIAPRRVAPTHARHRSLMQAQPQRPVPWSNHRNLGEPNDVDAALHHTMAQWANAAERFCGRCRLQRHGVSFHRDEHVAEADRILGQLHGLLPKLASDGTAEAEQTLAPFLWVLVELLRCVMEWMGSNAARDSEKRGCDASTGMHMVATCNMLGVLQWFGTCPNGRHAQQAVCAAFVEALCDARSTPVLHTTLVCWCASLCAPETFEASRVPLAVWCLRLMARMPTTAGNGGDDVAYEARKLFLDALLSCPNGTILPTTAERRLMLDLLLEDWSTNRTLYCSPSVDRNDAYDLTALLAACVLKVGDPAVGCRLSAVAAMRWIEVLGACDAIGGERRGVGPAEGEGSDWLECCCAALSWVGSSHPDCLGDARVAHVVGKVAHRCRVAPPSNRVGESLTCLLEQFALQPPRDRGAPHVADALLDLMDALAVALGLSPAGALLSDAHTELPSALAAWRCALGLLKCAAPVLAHAPSLCAARVSFVLVLLLRTPLPAQQRKALAEDVVSLMGVCPPSPMGAVKSDSPPSHDSTVALVALQLMVTLHHAAVLSYCLAAKEPTAVPGGGRGSTLAHRTKRDIRLEPAALDALLQSVERCWTAAPNHLREKTLALRFLQTLHGHLLVGVERSRSGGNNRTGLAWCELIACARLYEEHAELSACPTKSALRDGDPQRTHNDTLKEQGATSYVFVRAALAASHRDLK